MLLPRQGPGGPHRRRVPRRERPVRGRHRRRPGPRGHRPCPHDLRRHRSLRRRRPARGGPRHPRRRRGLATRRGDAVSYLVKGTPLARSSRFSPGVRCSRSRRWPQSALRFWWSPPRPPATMAGLLQMMRPPVMLQLRSNLTLNFALNIAAAKLLLS